MNFLTPLRVDDADKLREKGSHGTDDLHTEGKNGSPSGPQRPGGGRSRQRPPRGRPLRGPIRMSPLQWLVTQRVQRAQELLETTDETVDRIADRIRDTVQPAQALHPPRGGYADAIPPGVSTAPLDRHVSATLAPNPQAE
jgi:hypothetical protein